MITIEALEKMLIEAQDEVERIENAIEDYWQDYQNEKDEEE